MITTTKDIKIVNKTNFPKMMYAECTGLVVLFEKESVGAIVHIYDENKKSTYKVGYIFSDFDMEDFKDFSGSVEIKQF